METANLIQLSYSVDTFYFLISGVLVMWMAAGFAVNKASESFRRFTVFAFHF